MSAGVSLPTPTITSPTSTTSISSGGSVSFAGSCAPPSGDTVSGYTWTFAGTDSQTGQPLTMQLLHAQNPGNVTFDQNGTWTVTFDCTDSAGLADGTPPTVTVNVGASGHPIPPTGPGAPLSGGGSHGGGGAFSLIGLLGLLCLLVIAKRGTIGRRTDVTGARWRFQESDGIFSPLDRS